MGCTKHGMRLTMTGFPRLGFGLLALAAASVAGRAAAADYPSQPGAVRLRGQVMLAEHAELAPREAGILTYIAGADGKNTKIERGQLVMQLDDTKAQEELRVAKAKLLAAKTKADDEINIEYSQAAAKMAVRDLEFSVSANKKVHGSVPQAKIDELELKVTETTLAIKKAIHDREVARTEAGIAAAEFEAAKTMIELLKLNSPIDGEVDEVRKHVGEAVQATETGVIHIVNRNKLWVRVSVPAREIAREQVENQLVTVEVDTGGGRKFSVQGKVISVSPETDSGGTYTIRAEVRREGRDAPWPLYPGMQAEMVVTVKALEASR
jgi:multidrug resistance efflux pump